jgi:hypothetical protein
VQRIREDIKEESGANDSSRGNFRQGVTAASAIRALQVASTKRARMATARLYEAFRQAVRMEIEVEREFNLYLRPVTVYEDGRAREAFFDSSLLMEKKAGGASLPIEFYISVKASQQDPFSASAQNELILQLLQAGAIEPKQAVELMIFEGKDQVLKGMKPQE